MQTQTRPPSANPFKASGLGNMTLATAEPNPFKDSGLGSMTLSTYEPNPFKDSGLGSMTLATGGDVQAAAEAGSPAQLQFVVQEVNKLLGTNYSLVSFDAKKGRDLLQVLNDVLANLSPNMKMDLTLEDPAVTQQRLSDFLCAILNYKTDNKNKFLDALLSGDETVIYPILHWVLVRMPENTKRVYLAKYLIPLNVPEDMIASDDEIREVHQHYKQLVEQFKESHKVVDKLKLQTNAEGAKASVTNLEQEKELLSQKVEALKKKLAVFGTKDAFFKACQTLRKQREEEQTLRDRMAEQLTLSKMADQRITQANQRQKDLQRDFGDLNVNRMIRALQDEISMNQLLVSDKMPKQIEEYREKVDNINRIVNSSVDTDTLSKAVYSLEKDIQEIEDRSRPKLSAAEEQSLGLFKQQAALVANRKEKFLEELQGIRDQKRKFEDQLAAKESELHGYAGSKILKGEEFRQYANSLRGKSTTYKKLKAELLEMKAELGVLQRTEEILGQKAETLDASLAAVEQSKGIDGYRSVKDNLVQVTENKLEADEAKNKTLEELNKVVSDFVNVIRNKRNKLAPAILELRNTRQKLQTVEQELQQKKEIYDALNAELGDETSKLQAEVDQYLDECKQNESLYHRLHCQIALLEVQLKRVQDEKEFRAGTRKLSERFKSYTDMFEQQVAQLEGTSRELRERKKEIEESHDNNLKQMRWFKDLHTLLECKVAYYKRQASGVGVSQGLAGVDMNPLVGVDRLVL